MENDPSLRTSQDSQTSPLPGQQSPKTLVILSGLINISQQQYSDDRTSWTSVTSTSSQQQALVLHLRDTFSQLAVATRQQRSVKGQPNEGQSLKSEQTFHFEAERYYFTVIGFEVFAPACLFMHKLSYNNRSHDLLTLSKSWSIQHYGLKSENVQLCLTLCLAVLPEHVLNRHVLS